MIVTLTGPSGTGKSRIARYMAGEQVSFGRSRFGEVVSVTTRERRPHEVDGVDYHFLTEEQFDEIESSLVERVEYRGKRYGIQRPPEEGKVKWWIAVVDRHGRDQFRALYGDRCLSVLILPPSLATLRRRLIKRGDSPEAVEHRLAGVTDEIVVDEHYEKIVVNREWEPTALDILFWLVDHKGRRSMK